jgi:hypothetical protein
MLAMLRLSSPFILDLRSIALFRVLLGLTMLYDVLARIPYVGLYLSDAGVLSRVDLLATINRPWAFSVYMLVGEPIQVQFILIVHALAACMLVAGFRTRLSSVVCWVLLVSLQHRNSLLLNGGDTLLALYAFWAMFLPLNARWSLDRSLAGDRKSANFDVWKSNNFFAIPGIAIILQTLMVYVFSVVLKSGDLWRNGEAVSYVVRNLGLIKAGALWFQGFDSAQSFFTYLTFHWEWVGCALVLCPFANRYLRIGAIFGFVVMQLVFRWMLDLALFPIVSITGWLVLLPGIFWEVVARFGKPINMNDRLRTGFVWVSSLSIKGEDAMVPGRSAAIFCGIVILSIFAWNLNGLPDSSLNKVFPKIISDAMYTLKLRQKWGMFASNPPQHSGWYTIEAQMANGDTVDLFNPKTPYTLRRPDLFTDRYPDRRWGKYLDNIRKTKYRDLRDDYLDYFVDRWNEGRENQSKIQSASLIYLREPIQLDGSRVVPELFRLATIHPSGVVQVDSPADALRETGEDPELEDL